MRRMTKNLPLVRRVLAKAVHAIQLKAIMYPSMMWLYYFLARYHFKLHFGFDIKNSRRLRSQRIAFVMAARRHNRIVAKSGLMTAEQLQIFKKQIHFAFKEGVGAE